MKRLVLSLCLAGVVFSGHTPLVIETVQGPPPSIRQVVEARAVFPPLSPAMPDLSQVPTSGIEQAAVRSPTITGEDTQSLAPPHGDIQKELLPTGEPSVSPVPDAEKHEAN